MQDFIDLLPRIQLLAPTAPIPLLLDAIHTTAVTYCRMSNAYRYISAAIPAVEGTTLYTVPIPAGTRICKAIAATINGTPLRPANGLLQMYGALPGTPAFYQLTGNIVQISPAPSGAITPGFLFEVALEPSLSAMSIDSVFLEEHYQGIVAGAIAHLLMLAGQPWSAPQLAGVYQAQFYAAIADAESRANGDNTPKVRTTPYGGY